MFASMLASFLAFVSPSHHTQTSSTVAVETGSAWMLVVDSGTHSAHVVASFSDQSTCFKKAVGLSIADLSFNGRCIHR